MSQSKKILRTRPRLSYEKNNKELQTSIIRIKHSSMNSKAYQMQQYAKILTQFIKSSNKKLRDQKINKSKIKIQILKKQEIFSTIKQSMDLVRKEEEYDCSSDQQQINQKYQIFHKYDKNTQQICSLRLKKQLKQNSKGNNSRFVSKLQRRQRETIHSENGKIYRVSCQPQKASKKKAYGHSASHVAIASFIFLKNNKDKPGTFEQRYDPTYRHNRLMNINRALSSLNTQQLQI